MSKVKKTIAMKSYSRWGWPSSSDFHLHSFVKVLRVLEGDNLNLWLYA